MFSIVYVYAIAFGALEFDLFACTSDFSVCSNGCMCCVFCCVSTRDVCLRGELGRFAVTWGDLG